jgi:photosystem II stability/assembly factor-like uncharacterized protein
MRAIAVGTVKGLFVFEDGGGGWRLRSRSFAGHNVNAAAFADGRLWASPSTEWTGATVQYSEDLGETWTETAAPLVFPESAGAALAKVWQIVRTREGRLFCGVEPSALFYSDDDGASWTFCEGLWNHPHRAEWEPGYGGLCLHTVLPLGGASWIVAISTGGAYRTDDAGENWKAVNRGIVALFLPDKTPEFGQCVHKIARDAEIPGRLYLQHHWGVYRSDDRGETWTDTGKGKLPTDFGFACASGRSGTVFVIPIESDYNRVFPEGRMRVFRSRDAGETWEGLGDGLPQSDVFDCVLRDALDVRGETDVAFGTTGGSLYFSDDEGGSWTRIAGHLPRIACVRQGPVRKARPD